MIDTDVGSETDAVIIASSVHEPELFTALYERHAPAIHRYVARRLGTDMADDLMAETFLIAFRQRESYDQSRPDARPWLYGIATNLVAQHAKAEARMWRTIARTGIDPAMDSPADRVVEQVSASGTRRSLAAALARLHPGQRDVLLLTAAGGLTSTEIATALGVSPGTVHSRLNRARKKMRAAFGGIDPLDVPEGLDR
ncbi:RNA polymerase sigma factor [Actinoallomurus iriomotensis]|uniref:DNA-directed RNA polymerase sigma-70 factor n=1 Tax=Actinoallomurus iriomotensis TaxID=478107 RepID=A0A9W6VN92_9ACTN|nr:RNA polymerase sigma factor [Actinoallomurus iriomotensis]GLY78518.1 DNA-directed RNA polymerase sigma-70 factor [Actinoallomurus iriomotensis]